MGLVQAAEHAALEPFIERAAEVIERSLDLDALIALCSEYKSSGNGPRPFPPLGRRVAFASDQAFAFIYPHILNDWHDQGIEILPFSPLADEPPSPDADAIFLPGGCPELHAGRLAGNTSFFSGLRQAATSGAPSHRRWVLRRRGTKQKC